MRKLPFATAIVAAGLSFTAAHASTIILGAYPSSLMFINEQKGTVVQHVPLTTGLPSSIRLSDDKKKLYVMTNDHSGIEVVDLTTRKVINHFELNDNKTSYRFNTGTPDPTGKYLYGIMTKMDKEVDRWEIGKPKYVVVDLEQKKIVKSYDIDKQDEDAFRGYGRGRLEISTDGKYLYQFGSKVLVIDTSNFKVVERIELEKPELPGFENVAFGGSLDSISQPGEYVSIFNAPDAFTQKSVFGVARFNLQTREYTFTPIGPSPEHMAGLQVSPNKKDAYTVVENGTLGNKRCEMWHFDLSNNAIKEKAEFPCRSRYYFGMSSDGKKLYIYGAGYEIEVYDAATLKLNTTWDLNNDATMAGLALIDN
jgi:hypothetical protein